MKIPSLIEGTYTRGSDYFQFNIDKFGLQKLSGLIQEAIHQGIDLSVSIGQGELHFEVSNSPIFETSASVSGIVHIKLWRIYFSELGIRFMQMANDDDPEHIGFIHVHLDTYFSKPGEGASDIVIEKVEIN